MANGNLEIGQKNVGHSTEAQLFMENDEMYPPLTRDPRITFESGSSSTTTHAPFISLKARPNSDPALNVTAYSKLLQFAALRSEAATMTLSMLHHTSKEQRAMLVDGYMLPKIRTQV